MRLQIIDTILDDYSPISLADMEGVCLMNRVDTKYTITLSMLPDFLKCLQTDYLMQDINGSRLNAYRTIYLDTDDRAMYLAHHNGRRTREKIRVRAYFDSKTIYLEVKNKDNRGLTKKKRFKLQEILSYQQHEAAAFLARYAKYPPETLLPRLESRFDRITLVNRKKTERLTIDLNLSFYNPSDGVEKQMDDLVIVELKQQGHQPSLAKDVLSGLHIRPVAISKYCLGTVLTVPDVKSNLLKEKIIQISKIRNKKYGFV